MSAWVPPTLAGVLAALLWTMPRAPTDVVGELPLEPLVREGIAAFVVVFGVACAALAYRNTLALHGYGQHGPEVSAADE